MRMLRNGPEQNNSGHGTGPQKKLREQNTASQNVIITAHQPELQEQELKPHAAPFTQQKAQNAFVQNAPKPSITTPDTHSIDGQQRGVEKEIDVETNGETDVEIFCSRDTLQKKRVKQSNDPLKRIRIHQAEMQEKKEQRAANTQQHKLTEQDNGELGGESLHSGTGSQKRHLKKLISECKKVYEGILQEKKAKAQQNESND
ncbi:hypothetical protein OCU04_001641 [Sclerotinia nivalis]|uniref:Uncharacterized protein n=1 Tax=Sclerotinia nivalis TaxID=352851 RepID=A0A9X0AYK2_9HELO|nr:hypothetical protein OCU04_001641 [Sclerotinia nivalis]